MLTIDQKRMKKSVGTILQRLKKEWMDARLIENSKKGLNLKSSILQSHYRKAKKDSQKESGKLQVGICLTFFLGIVGICLFVILLIGVFIMRDLTFQMLDEKTNVSNLDDLSKEGMAVMDVFKNMSYRFIEKDEWLIDGVLSAADTSKYPLNWDSLSSGMYH